MFYRMGKYLEKTEQGAQKNLLRPGTKQILA